MAGQDDLHLLGIGYRHVKGGEDDFANASKKIHDSGKEAGAGVESLEKALDGVKDSIKDAIGEAVALVAAYVSIHAAIDGVLEGVKLFATFDASMARLRGLAQLTASDFDLLSEEARKVGASTVFGADTAVAGMVALRKAGETTKETLENLPSVERLGIIAGIKDLGEAADDLGLTLNRFNQPASAAAHDVDVLAAMSQRSHATIGDFIDVMRIAGPAAGSMKVPIEDLGAALAVMAQKGGQARQQGGAMVQALAVLSTPTLQLVANLKQLHLTLDQVSPRTHTLVEIITTFAKANLDAGTAMAIFGHQQGLAFVNLTQHLPDVLAMQKALKDVDGTSEHLAATMEDNLGSSGERLEKVMDAVKLSIGAGLGPALQSVSEQLQGSLRGWQSAAESFGAALGKVLSVAVSGFVLFVEHGKLVAAVLIGIAIAASAVLFGPMILGAIQYAMALDSLALTEGFVAVASMELSLAWSSLTAAMAANPIGVIAIALGLLAAGLYYVVSANHDAQVSTAAYRKELEEGRPVIDGVTSAHGELVKKLREEIELRDKLSGKVDDNKARLAALKAIQDQMQTALGKGDTAGYDQATQAAGKLGVATSSLIGGKSALEQVQQEYRLLGLEVEADTKKIAANNDRLAGNQKAMKDAVLTVLAEELQARTTQVARIADLTAQQARAQAKVEALGVITGVTSADPANARQLTDALKEVTSEAALARIGLTAIDDMIKRMGEDAHAAAIGLLQAGKYDEGGVALKNLGRTDEQIKAATASWRTYNTGLAATKKAEEDATAARDAAIAKQREQARLYADEIKQVAELTRTLTVQIKGHRDVAIAYGESAEAGGLMKRSVDDEIKAAQASAKFTGDRRKAVHDLTMEELEGARVATIAEALATSRTETTKKLADGEARYRDILAGNTLASTAAATAAEVEDFRQKNLLATTDARVVGLRNLLVQRDAELRFYALAGAAATRDLDFSIQLRTAQAGLTDAKRGDTQASRDLVVALEIESRIKAEGAQGDAVASAKIAAEVIGRHALTDSITAQTTAERALTTLRGNAQVAGIEASLTVTTNSMRQVEVEALQFIQNLGSGSLTEGRRLFAALAEKEGVTVEQLTDKLKSLLGQVDDAQKASQLRGGGKTALDTVREESAEIERLMKTRSADSDKFLVSQSDGLKALQNLWSGFINSQLSAWSTALGILSQEFGGVFTKILRFVQILQEIQQLKDSVVSIISGLTSTAAGLGQGAALAGAATALTGAAGGLTGAAGGLLSAAGALTAAAGAQATGAAAGAVGSAAGSAVGAGAGAAGGAAAGGAGALGGVGAVLAAIPVVGWIIAAVILIVSVAANWIGSHSSTRAQGDLALEKGKFVLDNLKGAKEMTGRLGDTITAIGQSLNTYIDSLGAMVTDMVGKIGVTRSGRNTSNEFRVYVTSQYGSQLVKNFGRDADAAMQDAFYEALASSTLTTKTGVMTLDPIVLAAVKGAARRAADQMVAGITDAGKQAVKQAFDQAVADSQEVSSLGKPAFVATERKAIDHFDQLRATMEEILGPSAELVTALGNISAAEVQMWQSERDQLTGRQQTNAEKLAEMQNDAKIFNAELALRELNVKGTIADIETQKAGITAHAAGVRANVDYTSAFLQSLGIMGQGMIAFATTAGLAAGVLSDAQQAQLDKLNQEEKALQDLLAGLQGIKPIDPSEIRLPSSGSSSAATNRQSFLDELQKDTEVNLPSTVQAMLDLGRALADLTAKAKENHVAESALVAARQALIDQAKGQLKDPIRPYLDPSQGGTFGLSDPQKALADINKTFDDARAANLKLLQETGQRAVAFWQLNAAQLRAVQKLNEDTIASLGLPIEQTKAKAKGLADTMAFLKQQLDAGTLSADRYADVFKQVSDQAAIELLTMVAGLLDQMGRFTEADAVRRAADELNFQIQRIQFNIMLDNYELLGYISGALEARLEAARAVVNDPKNWPDFTQPAPVRASGGGGAGPAVATSNDDARRQAILDQITAWNNLGTPQATAALRDLHNTLVSMSADAQRLGISLSDLVAANANAVKDFWNQTLSQYESSSTNLLVQVAALNKTFDDLSAAAQQYGGDQARIQADRLSEVQKFWDAALQPIKQLQDQFKEGTYGGLSPEQQLASARQLFNTTATSAMQGDTSAIQRLPAVVQALLDQQKAFSGTGPAYQALVATIQGVLAQVMALGGVAPLAQKGLASAASQALAPGPLYLVPPLATTQDSRPLPLPAGGIAGGPIPMPAAAQDQRVDRLVSALEDDTQGRKDDTRGVAELRSQVDRLIAANREQGDRIDDLLHVVGRLATLVEGQERRAASGGGWRR